MTEMNRFNIKVMVAEDDPDDALLLRDAFEEIKQSSVVFYANGKLFAEQIERCIETNHLPELVIVDLNMPLLDGKAIIRLLKSKEETAHIPVIVLSTSKSQEDIDTAMQLGANNFFTKPAKFSELITILTDLNDKWLSNG